MLKRANINKNHLASDRQGLSLIELLVVMAIVSSVAIFLIPRLRTVSKERSRREAARTVATFFQEAEARARAEGAAGVVIARNPNVFRYVNSNAATSFDGTGDRVYFAGYRLYQMRQPPTYRGNSLDDLATVALVGPNLLVRIELPFDYDDPATPVRDGRVFEPGSTIRLNNSPIEYVIASVAVDGAATPPTLTMALATYGYVPIPPTGNVPFEVIPRLETDVDSLVELPAGYFINLNYSGGLDNSTPDLDNNPFTWTQLTQQIPPIERSNILVDPAYHEARILNPTLPQFVDPTTQPVVITFGSRGEIDRVYPYGMYVDTWVANSRIAGLPGFGAGSPPYLTSLIPSGGLNLSVAEDTNNDNFELNPATGLMPRSYANRNRDLLSGNEVLWVGIDNVTGRVSVSDSIELPANNLIIGQSFQPDPGDPFLDTMHEVQAMRILQSRGFAYGGVATRD